MKSRPSSGKFLLLPKPVVGSYEKILGVRAFPGREFPALGIGHDRLGTEFWVLLSNAKVISLHHDATLFEVASELPTSSEKQFLAALVERGSRLDLKQLLALHAGKDFSKLDLDHPALEFLEALKPQAPVRDLSLYEPKEEWAPLRPFAKVPGDARVLGFTGPGQLPLLPKTLERLEIRNSTIRRIPTLSLPNLHTLVIYNCWEVESLPDLSRLKSLRRLDVRGTPLANPGRLLDQIAKLPLEFIAGLEEDDALVMKLCRFPKLKQLDAQWCTKLPDGLPPLEQIRLGSKDVARNLEKLARVPTLRRIDFTTNAIASVPKQIGKLTQLESLSFWQNMKLKKLPPDVGKLTNLKYLNLGLTAIPKAEKAKWQRLLPNAWVRCE